MCPLVTGCGTATPANAKLTELVSSSRLDMAIEYVVEAGERDGDIDSAWSDGTGHDIPIPPASLSKLAGMAPARAAGVTCATMSVGGDAAPGFKVARRALALTARNGTEQHMPDASPRPVRGRRRQVGEAHWIGLGSAETPRFRFGERGSGLDAWTGEGRGRRGVVDTGGRCEGAMLVCKPSADCQKRRCTSKAEWRRVETGAAAEPRVGDGARDWPEETGT